MKALKKAMSVLVAALMIFTFALPAFADDNNAETQAASHTITIKSKYANHTFEAYQVLKGTYGNENGTLGDVEWGSGVKSDELLAALNAENGDFKTAVTAADVAKVLTGYLNSSVKLYHFADVVSDHLAATATATSSVTSTSTENGTDYTISVAEDGYYFVKDTTANAAATRYLLQVVGGNVEITAKEETPDLDKKIETANGDKNAVSANVGEKIPFKLTSKVPDMGGYTTYSFVVKDTMSKGLTFNNDVKVTIGGSNYTVDTTSNTESNGVTTITIDFGSEFIKQTAGDAIVITYTVTLNDNALTTNKETNKAHLEYSNNPSSDGKGETPDKETKVYDFNIAIDKFDGKDSTKKLKGAEFVLRDSDNDNAKYYHIDDDNNVTWVNTEAEATKVTTNADGKATFKGLKADTYYLEETKAPAGYNKLDSRKEIKITENYTEDGSLETSAALDNNQYTQTVKVANNQGTVLPGTGGIGTTIFYVIGGLMMAVAAVLFITKKRMGSDK